MELDIEQRGFKRRSDHAHPDSFPSSVFPDEHQRKIDLDSPKLTTTDQMTTGDQKKLKGDGNNPFPNTPSCSD